jgi:hypothetical protein
MLAHFLYVPIDRGLIPSLDPPLAEWVPELTSLNPQLQHKEAKLTWQHFIDQTKAYGGIEPPGQVFDYNDSAMALFTETLILTVWKVTWADAEKLLIPPHLGAIKRMTVAAIAACGGATAWMPGAGASGQTSAQMRTRLSGSGGRKCS